MPKSRFDLSVTRTAARVPTAHVRRWFALGLVLVLQAWWGIALAGEAAGELRVLKLRHHEINHPHRDIGGEFRLLTEFARHEGMHVRWIDAVRPAELLQKLARGEGDIVIADLEPVADAARDLLPSVALGAYRDLAVGRGDVLATTPLGLAGQRVAAAVSSPLWSYLSALGAQLPGLTVVALPDNTRREEALAGLNAGAYDVVFITARVGEDPLEAQPRLKQLFELSAGNVSRWHVAAESTALRARLDAYLLRYHASVSTVRPALGDLDRIRARHVLRVITRLDPGNYFVTDGRPAGFEFELVRDFARELGLNLEVLVAESDAEVLEWLRLGVGDIATTRVSERIVRADPALTQSRHYHFAPVVLVQPGRVHHPAPPAALTGKRIGVRMGSMAHRTLGELVANGLHFETRLIPATAPLQALAGELERGIIDAVFVEAHHLAELREHAPGLVAGATLPSPFHYTWTLRASNPALRARIDTYLERNLRETRIATLASRHFGASETSVRMAAHTDRLSPYDELVRRHADASGFDWRLIVALMYLESRFDPRAVSRAGSRGLMQLQPATARALGVGDPFDPDAGIAGGVRYLAKLRQRFDDDIAPRDRTWFALAAYNIGYAQVARARRRAEILGLDSTRWFGHVEQVMRQLAREDRRRHWGQTVNYVRTIRSLYDSYHLQQAIFTTAQSDDDTGQVEPTG